jgi:hypothetical protein
MRPALSGPAVIAGTPNDLLKFTVGKFAASSGPDSFAPLDLLVIDEASMLGFPAALALAAKLLRPDGRLLLAGDHRQLAAITKYDFERDLRPSVVMHRAHVSAYDYVWALGQAGEQGGAWCRVGGRPGRRGEVEECGRALHGDLGQAGRVHMAVGACGELRASELLCGAAFAVLEPLFCRLKRDPCPAAPPPLAPRPPAPNLPTSGAPHVALTQLSCSWRFSTFDRLRALIASVYARDRLSLVAPPSPTPPALARALVPAYPKPAMPATAASPRRTAAPRLPATRASGGAGPAVAGGAPLGPAAASAIAAAGGEVLPGLLGGVGGVGGAEAGRPLYGGRRGLVSAAVGAMSLELMEGDDALPHSPATPPPAAPPSGAPPPPPVPARRAPAAAPGRRGGEGASLWARAWAAGAGQLVLVLHDEAASAKHNALEVEVVRRIMQVSGRGAGGEAGPGAWAGPGQGGVCWQAL